MEDNSYVNLSLQKYNELYDKAKKYDELTNELGDKITECITTIFDHLTSDEEHSGETEQEEVEDTELKVGDKVRLVKSTNCTYGFKLGEICTIVSLNELGYYHIRIENETNIGYVNKEHIKKIKEEN